MKQKWYFSNWFIGVLFACWFIYGIPLIIGIIIVVLKNSSEKKRETEIRDTTEKLTSENQSLKADLNIANSRLEEIGAKDLYAVKEEIESSTQQLNRINSSIESVTAKYESNVQQLKMEIERLNLESQKLDKTIQTNKNKLARIKELYKGTEHAINNFLNIDVQYEDCKLPEKDFEDIDLITPSIILKLHCMDVKSLRKAYRENEKQINKVLDQYSSRYTTKANKAIYNLMVIALRAELQNILYNLKYEKLDSSVDSVKQVSQKYLKIAAEGNQSIAGTLTKFIGEIEYLFINAVKIEYNYYVKREQARQEQLALREQMRQETEERKALEAERKKIEQEEEKYHTEIAKIKENISSTSDESELELLRKRILELESQLSEVVVKKDEIINLQNGKAGTVYIISNLGSFGDHIFKIGMTRRLDPQDRVNELGNASVPFKFDVHSFIFSEDASSLETELHKRLDNRRVNKVNARKEFFDISLDELEELVDEICPTAEFNRTMLAEEFRQSSSGEIYSTDFSLDNEDDDE